MKKVKRVAKPSIAQPMTGPLVISTMADSVIEKLSRQLSLNTDRVYFRRENAGIPGDTVNVPGGRVGGRAAILPIPLESIEFEYRYREQITKRDIETASTVAAAKLAAHIQRSVEAVLDNHPMCYIVCAVQPSPHDYYSQLRHVAGTHEIAVVSSFAYDTHTLIATLSLEMLIGFRGFGSDHP